MDIDEILRTEKVKVDAWHQQMQKDKAALERAGNTKGVEVIADLEKNLADTFSWYERTLKSIQAQHEKYLRPDAVKHMERLRKMRLVSVMKHHEANMQFLKALYRKRRK